MFHSHREQSQISISLAAIAVIVHDVTIDRSLLDHSTSTVPHIRIANQETVTKHVDDIASFVGTEKGVLKVGELLYNKGAEIGPSPDGMVTKSYDEKIATERVLNEWVNEEHFHSERVINPAIEEIVAMVGQIDEFKRVRARVKQAAIVQHLRPTEVDKIDSDVKDFLEQPEVKDGFERLSEADEKMHNCLAQLAEFETMEGDESAPEFSADDVASNESIAEYRESQYERHSSAQYATVEAQKDSVADDCLKHATAIRKHSKEFAQNHPYWSKAGSLALKGVGYLGIAGIAESRDQIGGKRIVTCLESQMLSQEIVASVIENGADSLVDYAISYANDENEATEFAETAVWSVETALADAEIAGITALIKDRVAVSSTLAATKVNVSATARAKFSHKQNLRAENSQKNLLNRQGNDRRWCSAKG
jgi:hypothetical protein